MSRISGGSVFRKVIQLCAALGLTASAAFPQALCPDYTGKVQFDPQDQKKSAMCAGLWSKVRNPSLPDGTPKPLNEYEASVGKFFNNFCYRDPSLTNAFGTGWAVDKDVRDTGPYVSHRNEKNEWVSQYHGFHAPVVIWYSPDMIDWLERNRPPGLEGETYLQSDIDPIPDGVMIVKEMYTPPASRCAGQDIAKLKPKNGIAYMIRDSKAAHDGWFWGYFGFFDAEKPDPNIDWPAPKPVTERSLNSPPYAGFGQYCLNCHASAVDNSTFSSLKNIKGYPGKPLVFLSQDWMLTEMEGDIPEHVPQPSAGLTPIPNSTPLAKVPTAFGNFFNVKSPPGDVASFTLPSQTYDNVWVQPGKTPPLASEYVTSDQCIGCHDAGSTGLAFDMTLPNPHGDDLINLSPYATWRSSPMGLAGRDPIFFAQLSSEEGFHPKSLDLIWNTCFGCHGIMGQRQLQLDKAADQAACKDVVFRPDMVTAIPYDKAQTSDLMAPHYDLANAKYGALARDGISCVACHRSVLTPDQEARFAPQEQNKCVLARQQELNVGIGNLTGFGKTFTGSFLVSDPGTLFGPFDDPKTKPMAHALNNIPKFDPAIASSEQCGTCHTVHLPVLWLPEGKEPEIIASTYEQTTYPEWLFSKYRTGTAAFLNAGEMLPGGAGETPISCAGCHLESHGENGAPFRSKIASIQERSGMPEAEYVLSSAEIDLPTRTGFARHTLVGLNLFLIKMAQQFPEVLGIPIADPMLVANGMPGLQRTEDAMVENARQNSADITVLSRSIQDDALAVKVRVNNRTGHKFPSGVSFRRAFVQFEVLDINSKTLWQSGATNEYGILLGADGKPLPGELWYDNRCERIVDQTTFQKHYEKITSQDQVQIYQEVKLTPGDPAQVAAGVTPSCAEDSDPLPSARMTTSFLSICHTPKDNRLLPEGQLSFDLRVKISEAMGLVNDGQAEKMAIETGAAGVGADQDYVDGGGDTLDYVIPLADIRGEPAAIRATLHYQATPPFYLQDRFCTGSGANRDRLFHLTSLLETKGTPIEDWKFKMVSTGEVALQQ